jgi:hypothetical protein
MTYLIKGLLAAHGLFLLFCASTIQVVAQNDSSANTAQNVSPAGNVRTVSAVSKAYLEGAVGFGSYEGGVSGFGAKMVLNNKWIVGITYMGMTMTPKNKPSDYVPETGLAVFFPYTIDAGVDMTMLNFTFGRYFGLSRTIWATTGGGISFVRGDKVTFTPQQQVTTGIFPAVDVSSNYGTTSERVSSVGLILEADINWAFASFMGLGIGAHANINSIQSPVWADLKLMVGRMGRPKKNKK